MRRALAGMPSLLYRPFAPALAGFHEWDKPHLRNNSATTVTRFSW